MAPEISGNYGSRSHVAKTQSTWADYDKQKRLVKKISDLYSSDYKKTGKLRKQLILRN